MAPTRSWAWDARTLARKSDDGQFSDIRNDVRETATACFAAWGKTYRNIVVRLSGGLDSSAVLNLARHASDARITALHVAGVGARDREREMAHIAAAHAGVELIEAPLDPATTDLRSMLEAPRLPRPTKQILGLAAHALVASVCDDLGADGIMTGHGGDTLFLQRSGMGRMLSDYLRLRGPDTDFPGVAYQAAMLLERSVWDLAGAALQQAMSAKPWRPFPFLEDPAWRQDRLMRPDAIAALPRACMVHPWLEDLGRLPSLKAEQLTGIVGLRHFHFMLGHALPRDALLPLLSQPLVELCLRTPSYQFGHGGVDRALERQAFADLLPEPILKRTDKGMIDNHMLEVMQRNLPFLRELILDGVVIQQGFINRSKTERALTREHMVRGARMDEVFNLAVAEAWLRRWPTD